MTSELQRIEPQAIAVAPGQSAALLEVIGRAAKDPSVDIEKMERLLAMQERVLKEQSRAAYSIAMQACQAEMPTITKDARNPHTNSKYTRFESLIAAAKPIYTKHGFSLSFGTSDCPTADTIRVTCIVRHTAGHSEEHHADVPLDNTGAKGSPSKTRTHGFGSSLSYGRRYLTLLIFNIPTGEDNDGNGPPKEDEQKAVIALRDELRGLLKHQGAHAQQWLWDEVGMAPDRRVQDLNSAELREILEKTKKRMAELNQRVADAMKG